MELHTVYNLHTAQSTKAKSWYCYMNGQTSFRQHLKNPKPLTLKREKERKRKQSFSEWMDDACFAPNANTLGDLSSFREKLFNNCKWSRGGMEISLQSNMCYRYTVAAKKNLTYHWKKGTNIYNLQ